MAFEINGQRVTEDIWNDFIESLQGYFSANIEHDGRIADNNISQNDLVSIVDGQGNKNGIVDSSDLRNCESSCFQSFSNLLKKHGFKLEDKSNNQMFDFGDIHCEFTASGLTVKFSGNMSSNSRVFLSIENSDGKIDTPLSLTSSDGSLYLHPRTFHMAPGENRFTICVEDKNGREIAKKIIVVEGDGFSFKKDGVSIRIDIGELHDRVASNQNLLGQITSTVASLNPFLPDNLQPRTIFIENRPNESQGIVWGRGFILTSGNFKESDISVILAVFHESAHFVGNFIEKNNPEEYAHFQDLFNHLSQNAPGLFKLLDESEYLEGVNGSRGHPDDNSSELFASASAILRYFPEELVRRISELDGVERRLAVNIAKFVVDQYMKSSKCPEDFFSNDLIRFLDSESSNL